MFFHGELMRVVMRLVKNIYSDSLEMVYECIHLTPGTQRIEINESSILMTHKIN